MARKQDRHVNQLKLRQGSLDTFSANPDSCTIRKLSISILDHTTLNFQVFNHAAFHIQYVVKNRKVRSVHMTFGVSASSESVGSKG